MVHDQVKERGRERRDMGGGGALFGGGHLTGGGIFEVSGMRWEATPVPTC